MARLTRADSVFAVSSLNGVAFTGIPIALPLDFGVSLRGFPTSQRRAGQPDAELGEEDFIAAGLVDPVRQNGAGIAAELAKIIFHSGLKVAAFVEIAPAGLHQIGISIHHGKVQFLPEFGGVWTFAPLD